MTSIAYQYNQQQAPAALQYQGHVQPISDPDVIDAEYYEHQPVRVLPAPQPLGLPAPDRRMSVDEILRACRSGEQPELIEIDLTKRR